METILRCGRCNFEGRPAAERRLIDGYLMVLGRTLGRLRRAPDLVAEVEDHLMLSVEEKTAAGLDPVTAQTKALEQLGDPHLLAASLAAGFGTGVALPSALTRAAGKAAVIAGAGWIIWDVLAQAGVVNLFDPVSSDRFFMVLFDVTAVVAYFGAILTLLGMLARSGAARSPLSILALFITALGMLNFYSDWGRAVSLLLTLLFITGCVGIGWRWYRALRGPIWPLLLLPSGPGIELAALLVHRFSASAVGPWRPSFILFDLGMIAFGAALCGCAFLLRDPVDAIMDQ